MPAKYRDLRRALGQLGYSIDERPGKGSHVLVRDAARQISYSLPLSNGDKTELSDVYVKALCRRFLIDVEELRKLL